jgi:hypothetical protein
VDEKTVLQAMQFNSFHMFIMLKTKKRLSSLKALILLIICWHFVGAENEIRTRDPQLGKLMLYQLSYFRVI